MELQSNPNRYFGFIQDEDNLLNLKNELKVADEYLCKGDYDLAIEKYMTLA